MEKLHLRSIVLTLRTHRLAKMRDEMMAPMKAAMKDPDSNNL